MSRCQDHSSAVVMLLLVWVAGCQQQPPSPRQQAITASKRGDWALTVECCTPLLENAPEDIQLLSLRANAFLGMKRPTDAIDDFTTLIRLDPENKDYYYLRQLAYQRAGLSELAEADGNKARQIDPLYKSAYQFESHNFLDVGPLDKLVSDGDEEANDDTDAPAGPKESDDEQADRYASQDEPTATDEESVEAMEGDKQARDDALAVSQPDPDPAAVNEEPAAQEPNAGEGLLRKWLTEKRRGGESTQIDLPDEPSPLDVPFPPPKLSTALPEAPAPPERPADSLIPLPAGPRTTGLPASLRPLPTAPTTGLGARSTGIQSSRPVSIGSTGLPVSPAAPTTPGFQPGRFLARPSYPPGTTPSLTTSLPGTASTTAAARRGQPVVSTQLPAERAVPPPVVRGPSTQPPK